jgi:hypothetical protein
LDQGTLVDFFIRTIENDFKEIKEELKSQDAKLNSLLMFKWQVIGGSVAVSAIVTTLIQIFSVLAQK